MSEETRPVPLETEPSWRARKRRRAAITLLVLVAALAAAFYYAATYWQADPASQRPVCPTSTPTSALTPSKVTINVYNATTRNGLAAKTSTTFKGFGFRVGKVSNDPKKKTIKASAEIRYGSKSAAAAKLVASYIPKSVLVKDKRTDAVVDVVLGNGFVGADAPKATPTDTGTVPPGC